MKLKHIPAHCLLHASLALGSLAVRFPYREEPTEEKSRRRKLYKERARLLRKIDSIHIVQKAVDVLIEDTGRFWTNRRAVKRWLQAHRDELDQDIWEFETRLKEIGLELAGIEE